MTAGPGGGSGPDEGTRQRVFVYGTLRSGGSNAWRMAGARRVSAATVRGRLYQVSWYPALVLDAAGGAVVGEVWEAGDELLAGLDRFEGGEYRRVRAVVLLETGREETAWVWEWRGPVDGLRRIEGGDWLVADGT